ncbi:THAP domain-containing protein 2-like [Hydra vulgaris]|uniref:THAP domain-containing protein 2-like n=1 Tax=Hydra vulgaris TaxID=6087 RepID=A0ABM4CTW2_HYDVU
MSGLKKDLRGSECSAYGCKKRKRTAGLRSDSSGSSDEESVVKRKLRRTFHLFPLNEDHKREWILKMHRDNWQPSKSGVICSDHFMERDINRTGQTVRLKNNATPTRFKQFPDHLKKDCLRKMQLTYKTRVRLTAAL